MVLVYSIWWNFCLWYFIIKFCKSFYFWCAQTFSIYCNNFSKYCNTLRYITNNQILMLCCVASDLIKHVHVFTRSVKRSTLYDSKYKRSLPCPHDKIWKWMDLLHGINCCFNQQPWGITMVVAIFIVAITLTFDLVTHVQWITLDTVVGIVMKICDLPKVTCKRYKLQFLMLNCTIFPKIWTFHHTSITFWNKNPQTDKYSSAFLHNIVHLFFWTFYQWHSGHTYSTVQGGLDGNHNFLLFSGTFEVFPYIN